MNTDDVLFTVLFSTLLILLLIAAVIIAVIAAGRQKVKQQAEQATLRLNYEQELRTATVEMQEHTMASIARELHDNVGQLLTVMKIQIEQSKITNMQATNLFAPLDVTLSQAHQELRLLSKSLGADQLHQYGLLPALEKDILKIQSLHTFGIRLQHDNCEPSLHHDERLMAYRIFQELMQNILKHAEAQTVSVRLLGKQGFTLEVTDDGKGFDYVQASAGQGSGIRNMLKRAGMARFDCTIRSVCGSGTTITIHKETDPLNSNN